MSDLAPANSRRRATLRVAGDCDNVCVFCAQDGLAATAPSLDEVRSALSALRVTADELTFVGGEPTRFAPLPRAIELAREAGFVRVGIQSHLRAVADDAAARSLADAGLTDAVVSLHGADAALHDYHTGIAGSLAASLAGLANLRTRGVTIGVVTVLTRSNYRSLSTLPPLLLRRGVSAWSILLPHASGRAGASFDRVMPRLGMAIPFALHALDQARTLGLAAFVQGAPLCLLGPLVTHAIEDEPRAYASGCDACLARDRCPGLDATYLARFRADELSARRAPTATIRRSDALTRLFVGAGERAVSALAVPAGRVSLPLVP